MHWEKEEGILLGFSPSKPNLLVPKKFLFFPKSPSRHITFSVERAVFLIGLITLS